MSVLATYAVNEYMASVMNPFLDEGEMEFDPGSPGAATSDTTFCTYKLVQGRDHNQPYIHMDSLTVKVYHTSFDILQNMVDAVLDALNNESVYDNADLMAAGLADDIRFQNIVATAGDHAQNDFIDSTEYHTVRLDILLEYIKL